MSIELGQHTRKILIERGENLSLEQRTYVESVALRGEADELRTKSNGNVEIKEADPLFTEWQKQAAKLATLFASELGLTPEQYATSLPKFELQPEEFKGRFDIPVIVETRIPLSRMLELAGINKYFDVDVMVKDWKGGDFKTPEIPYTAWMQDGGKYLDRSVRYVRSHFDPYERGATIYDGIALYFANPKILKSYSIDFPGSQVSSDYCPCLELWGGRLCLDYYSVVCVAPRFGSVSCGGISK